MLEPTGGTLEGVWRVSDPARGRYELLPELVLVGGAVYAVVSMAGGVGDGIEALRSVRPPWVIAAITAEVAAFFALAGLLTCLGVLRPMFTGWPRCAWRWLSSGWGVRCLPLRLRVTPAGISLAVAGAGAAAAAAAGVYLPRRHHTSVEQR